MILFNFISKVCHIFFIINIMEKYFDDTIDLFIDLIEKTYPNYLKIDLNKFISDNKISFNKIISFVEDQDFDIQMRFLERLNLYKNAFNNKLDIEQEKQVLSKLFHIFVDYCYYLQIQEKKDIKDFIMPSNEAFEYKMNNDIRPASNKTYAADILMSY